MAFGGLSKRREHLVGSNAFVHSFPKQLWMRMYVSRSVYCGMYYLDASVKCFSALCACTCTLCVDCCEFDDVDGFMFRRNKHL